MRNPRAHPRAPRAAYFDRAAETMARATLVHGATTFTDYFVLLKADGAWKIANKVYSSTPTK